MVSRDMISLEACNSRRENVYNTALLKLCGNRRDEGERHVRIRCCASCYFCFFIINPFLEPVVPFQRLPEGTMLCKAYAK
jgi:hypothetical protein